MNVLEMSVDAADRVSDAHEWHRLSQSRTIFVFGEINDKLARAVSERLVFLDQDGDGEIRVILNSPGGHVESGDTIHDMIDFVRSPVNIIATGWVASAGVHIYLAVEKNRRLSLPNTRFMIHQPSGGSQGKERDVAIAAEQIIKMRERIAREIAEGTGQPLEKVLVDIDRDFWMNTKEAIDYGLVGRVVKGTDEVRRS